MQKHEIGEIIDLLRSASIAFEPGLSEAEATAIEGDYGFRFPPDLRALLRSALPTGSGFPGWRTETSSGLRGWLDDPVEGICFDVRNGVFWHDSWGSRPADVESAVARARRELSIVPRMAPFWRGAYVPDEPDEIGNPVFGIHQADIIYYGSSLVTFCRERFGAEPYQAPHGSVRYIRFWGDIATW